MNLDLRNRHAIVCGSSQGIGLAAARELALLGATVTLMARDADRMEAARISLATGHSQTHSILVADFSRHEEVAAALDHWIANGSGSRKGVAEILVNNTGGPPGGPAIDAGLDEYLTAFRNHLIVNQILAQRLVSGMMSAGFGRIINVISTSVKQPLNNLGVSNTVRGAVANWAKTLATELGPFGITVNNVLPGATATARLESIVAANAEKSGQPVAEIEKKMLASIPAGRFGLAEEIGQAIAFLASPAAAYINGINLPVDGGRTQCL